MLVVSGWDRPQVAGTYRCDDNSCGYKCECEFKDSVKILNTDTQIDKFSNTVSGEVFNILRRDRLRVRWIGDIFFVGYQNL